MDKLPFVDKKTFWLTIASIAAGFLPVWLGNAPSFWHFIAVYSVQFAVFAFWVRAITKGWRFDLGWMVVLGLGLRAIMFASEPVHENDYYRYMWDGHVASSGINPYLEPPRSEKLQSIRTEYFEEIAYKNYKTIYPPVPQILFRFSQELFPGSLNFLRLIFVLFEIGTLYFVVRWLTRKFVDPAWSLLYWLNPLAVKEISNSAHFDSIAVFFVVASTYLFIFYRRKWLSWTSLGLAVNAKYFGFLALPFLIKFDRDRFRGFGFFALASLLVWLPFLGGGVRLLENLGGFARDWYFNQGYFDLVDRFFVWIASLGSIDPQISEWIYGGVAAKAALVPVFLFFCGNVFFWARDKEQGFFGFFAILSVLILFSPVVNGWYVYWVLPFVAIYRNIPMLVFSFFVLLGYSWHNTDESFHAWVRLLEYSLFSGLVLYCYLRRRFSFQIKIKDAVFEKSEKNLIASHKGAT